MTELLYNLFAGKDKNDPVKARSRCGAAASIVGILANVLLFAGKFTVGTLFGSIAMQADGINNLSDAGSSAISFISFRISGKPADREHPYGHARIEYVASMIVSFLILHIGFDLVTESIDKIVHPPEFIEPGMISIIVLAVSIVVKLLLFVFNRTLGKRINSEVVKATAADSLSDALATAAVLVSTIVMKYTGFDTDGYMGVVVAAIILIAGIKILLETKDHILGKAPDGEIVMAIKEIVGRYPEALGIHDMIIHNYGPGRTIASLHVEVDGGRDIYYTHDVIDSIEKQISEELSVICTIHLDPIVTDDEKVTALRQQVDGKIKEIDERLCIHDFRFVEGETHTNLIFDIVAPFEVKITDDDIVRKAKSKISEINENYFGVIYVDRE